MKGYSYITNNSRMIGLKALIFMLLDCVDFTYCSWKGSVLSLDPV